MQTERSKLNGGLTTKTAIRAGRQHQLAANLDGKYLNGAALRHTASELHADGFSGTRQEIWRRLEALAPHQG